MQRHLKHTRRSYTWKVTNVDVESKRREPDKKQNKKKENQDLKKVPAGHNKSEGWTNNKCQPDKKKKGEKEKVDLFEQPRRWLL